MLNRYSKNLLSAAFLCVLSAGATASESGLIQSQVGFIDPDSGVKVEAVDKMADQPGTRVLISVPANGDAPAIQIEEVLVTAPRIEQREVIKPRHEFIRDYSNGRHGYYIYLGEEKNLPFRIYFRDHDSDVLHNR
ncbi:MAG: hypothetical protein ACSHWQ_03735 [Spongiibacteraceae bacterium]